MKTCEQFAEGDVVSRLGDDEQVIIFIGDFRDLIQVQCIKADNNNIFAVGDTEFNLARRYEYVRTPTNPVPQMNTPNAPSHGFDERSVP